MKFTITVRNKGDSKTWDEPYEEDSVKSLADAKSWGVDVIKYFNRTRPDPDKDLERELVDVVVEQEKKK